MPSQSLVPRQTRPANNRQAEQPSMVRSRWFSFGHLGVTRTWPLHTHICARYSLPKSMLGSHLPAPVTCHGLSTRPTVPGQGPSRRVSCGGSVAGGRAGLDCMSHRRPPYSARSSLHMPVSELGRRFCPGLDWAARRKTDVLIAYMSAGLVLPVIARQQLITGNMLPALPIPNLPTRRAPQESPPVHTSL